MPRWRSCSFRTSEPAGARSTGSVSTLDELLAETLEEKRFVVWLLNTFSSLSLLLAAVGLYSLTSSLVTHRTREIGLRMALGAQGQDIFRLFLHWGLMITGVGLLLGLPAAWASSALLERWLFAEAPSQFVPLLIAVVTVGVVSLAACLWPSLRASRLDPLQALR